MIPLAVRGPPDLARGSPHLCSPCRVSLPRRQLTVRSSGMSPRMAWNFSLYSFLHQQLPVEAKSLLTHLDSISRCTFCTQNSFYCRVCPIFHLEGNGDVYSAWDLQFWPNQDLEPASPCPRRHLWEQESPWPEPLSHRGNFFLMAALAHWVTQYDLSQQIWQSLWGQTLTQASSSWPLMRLLDLHQARLLRTPFMPLLTLEAQLRASSLLSFLLYPST